MRSAGCRDLLAEPAHDLCAFAAGQPVDVQLTVQVAGLVLQAAGLLAGGRGQHRVDHIAGLAVGVAGEDCPAGVDLTGGDACPAGHLDRIEQLSHQPGQRVIKPGYRIREARSWILISRTLAGSA